MKKTDISRRVQEAGGIDEQTADSLVEGVLQLLKTTLKNGEPIAIQGFGTFKVREKKARQGRNPRTGEAVMISARRVVSFHPSPLLKQYVNNEGGVEDGSGLPVSHEVGADVTSSQEKAAPST
jgi:integration host factor subunit alpha